MSFLRSLFSARPPAPAPPAELHCSFCGKSRLEIHKLIAGPSTYICDECVALSAEIIGQEDPRTPYHAAILCSIAEQLDPRTPHPDARPFLRAAIELAREDRTLLVRIAVAARRFDDAETALAALRRIPRATAMACDLLDEAALLAQLERFGEALAVLHGAVPATMTPGDRVQHRLHVLYAQLREESDEAFAREALAALESLAGEVASIEDEALRAGLADYRVATSAYAHLRLGNARAALAIADARIAQRPELPGPRELRALALEALGDGPGADEARRGALERAHPSGHYARRLATRHAPFR